MRIRATSAYFHAWNDPDCIFKDCERRYCPEHRLLWRICETVKKGWQGDPNVVNGVGAFYEMGDCPDCEADMERKRLFKRIKEAYPSHSICPQCLMPQPKPDDIAIHLVDDHKWDAEKARLWLRDQIEEQAFYEKP